MRRLERPIVPDDALVGQRVALYTFDSWADLVDSCEATEPLPGSMKSSRDPSRGTAWCPHDWKESLALARTGWYDIEARIRSLAEDIAGTGAGSLADRVAFQMACQGEEYDVGALLEGVPECMYLPTSEITHGRTIYRIGVFPGGNGGLNSDAMVMQGAMTCALVAAIEARGQTCEVILSSRCGGGGGDTVAIQVDAPLMSAGDPIDIPFLAFAVAHPAVYRRFTFALMESDPEHTKMGCDYGGYGYVQNGVPKNNLDFYVPVAEKVAGWSVEQCSDWLKAELDRLDKGRQ